MGLNNNKGCDLFTSSLIHFLTNAYEILTLLHTVVCKLVLYTSLVVIIIGVIINVVTKPNWCSVEHYHFIYMRGQLQVLNMYMYFHIIIKAILAYNHLWLFWITLVMVWLSTTSLIWIITITLISRLSSERSRTQIVTRLFWIRRQIRRSRKQAQWIYIPERLVEVRRQWACRLAAVTGNKCVELSPPYRVIDLAVTRQWLLSLGICKAKPLTLHSVHVFIINMHLDGIFRLLRAGSMHLTAEHNS